MHHQLRPLSLNPGGEGVKEGNKLKNPQVNLQTIVSYRNVLVLILFIFVSSFLYFFLQFFVSKTVCLCFTGEEESPAKVKRVRKRKRESGSQSLPVASKKRRPSSYPEPEVCEFFFFLKMYYYFPILEISYLETDYL